MTAPKRLTAAQVAQFDALGYVSPVAALTSEEVASYQSCLGDLLGKVGESLTPSTRNKPHLYLKWVSDLVRHPNVLDAVEDLLGGNLLVWRSVFFIKPPHHPRVVAWHQDSAYWGLDSDAAVSAWIALTDSSVENGCLRVVGGSHREPEFPHTIRLARGNSILVRGQAVRAAIPEERATSLELKAGQFSLHHVRLLHASSWNQSDKIRVGLVVRYIATHVRQRGPKQSATLVRGVDACRHFEHEPLPRWDYDPLAVRIHMRSLRQYAAELLWETFIMRPSPRSALAAARVMASGEMWKCAARYAWAWAKNRVFPGLAR